MEISEVLDKIYTSDNEQDLFDNICYLQDFVDKNDPAVFFEKRVSKKGNEFSVLKNDYTIGHIKNIFKNPYFISSISNILKYQRDYKELKSVPNKILRHGYFVNLSLNCCFYFIAFFSNKLSHSTINYIGSYFWGEIKKLERYFSYEFTKIDILNAFENIIFDRQYFFQKESSIKINTDVFYYNFKKSRLIVGNYLIDFSIPILLANSFKKIVSAKKESGNKLSAKYAFNVLNSAVKKYKFLSRGFKLDNLSARSKDEISSFEYYFKTRESRKIFSLVNFVLKNLYSSSNDELVRKIDNSVKNLQKIKEFFYENYNVFPNYKGPRTIKGQWGNKSFLNTIKLFSVLDAIKNSTDVQWKIDVFLKCFGDWIDDLHDNINYFSELDDYDEVKKFLKSEENNAIEFKSTFGLPIQDYPNEEAFSSIKKNIVNEIAKTILAMANSGGGDIFIGVVEKVEKVSDNIKPHLVKKDGLYFLDINYSLKKEKEDFDSKRLSLQQSLKNLTKERLDFLDSLFFFRFYKIYIEDKKSFIEILNIKVKKSEKTIFMIEKDNWITLPKRLNGRVELVNPASEFRNK